MLLRRIRPLLVILFAVLAAIGVAAPASAATPSGTVTGRIVDSSAAAIPAFGVKLATEGPDGGYRSYTATTDASGTFTFSDVAPAHYVLLNDEAAWRDADPNWGASVDVSAGATVTVPTEVMLRAATVHGRLISSADGSPLAGKNVYAAGPSATTDVNGNFTIVLKPGTVTVSNGVDEFWFTAKRTTFVAEGAGHDFGTIALDPAGIVTTSIVSKSGRAIGTQYRSAVVDGCSGADLEKSACPGAELYATATSLQLKPGQHSIRYEVRNPVTAAVRQVTRTVQVTAGQVTALPKFIVPVVDPATRAAVEPATYKRGHAIVIEIREGAYIDGSKPHLSTTIRVSGHVIRPTSLAWKARANGTDVLVATLPKSLSAHKSLKARVIVHGTSVYAGQTSAAITLKRAG